MPEATDVLHQRIRQEILDNLDEELELELEETVGPGAGNANPKSHDHAFRQTYFHELFRLQSELVKLQDCVVKTGKKIVIIFEGRDAAGKGGVIKRISQRINPRVCRVAAWPRCPHLTTGSGRSGISVTRHDNHVKSGAFDFTIIARDLGRGSVGL